MLLTLNRSLWQTDIETLCRLIGEGDEVLLIQDAVSSAIEGNVLLNALHNTPAILYVLHEDVAARGLSEQISARVLTVDYTGFVALTAKHNQQLAW